MFAIIWLVLMFGLYMFCSNFFETPDTVVLAIVVTLLTALICFLISVFKKCDKK